MVRKKQQGIESIYVISYITVMVCKCRVSAQHSLIISAGVLTRHMSVLSQQRCVFNWNICNFTNDTCCTPLRLSCLQLPICCTTVTEVREGGKLEASTSCRSVWWAYTKYWAIRLMFFKRIVECNFRGRILPWSTPKPLAYYSNEPISKHLLKS